MQRDQFTAQEVSAIIAAQVSRTQRHEATDDLVENNGDLALLTKHIDKLHHVYLSLTT